MTFTENELSTIRLALQIAAEVYEQHEKVAKQNSLSGQDVTHSAWRRFAAQFKKQAAEAKALELRLTEEGY